MKPQAQGVRKELPPFQEELQVVEIIETSDFLGLEPLDCGTDFDNARGDFNSLSSAEKGFADLATQSGKRFFELFGQS